MITAENEKKVKLKKQITQILGWVISAVALYFVYHYVVQIDLEAAKAKLNIYWIPFVLVFLTSLLFGINIRTMWMTPFYLFYGVMVIYILQKYNYYS